MMAAVTTTTVLVAAGAALATLVLVSLVLLVRSRRSSRGGEEQLVELVSEMNARMESMLRAHYRERCTEGHLRMALVPEGAELATNEEVTWPAVIVRNVWLMPGIPEVFRMKLALVRERLRGGTPFVSRAVYTKMDEGDLKPLLDRVVAAHPGVEVGSYPKWADASYRTKLTFDGLDTAAVESAVRAFVDLLPAGEPQRVE